MPRNLSHVHRRINGLTFERAPRIRERHTLRRRIQNHEKVQRLTTIPISQCHDAARTNTHVDGLNGFVPQQRVRGRAGRKLAVCKARSEDPFVFAISERVRPHDPDARQTRSDTTGARAVDGSKTRNLGGNLAKLRERESLPREKRAHGFEFFHKRTPRLAIAFGKRRRSLYAAQEAEHTVGRCIKVVEPLLESLQHLSQLRTYLP